MLEFAHALDAVRTMLLDDAQLTFTWRRTDHIPHTAFRNPALVGSLVGRTLAQPVHTETGQLIAQAGATIDERMVGALSHSASDAVEVTPQPSVLTVAFPDDLGSTATTLATLTPLNLQLRVATLHDRDAAASTIRAELAERVRTDWTDVVIAPNTPPLHAVFPELTAWPIPASTHAAIAAGMTSLAGWDLPVVLMPENTFDAWIALHAIVVPAFETALECESSAATVLVQLAEYIDAPLDETTVVPITIRRGFARLLPHEKAWNLADGYIILQPGETYEAGTPIEAWVS